MMSLLQDINNATNYIPRGEVPEVLEPKVPPDNSPLWETLAGVFVREVSGITEAGSMNLAMQFLTMLSAYMQRYAWVGATKHAANLFTVVVGQTAISHRGDAERLATAAIHAAAVNDRVRKVGGVSSGEGIIFHVRDGVPDDEGDIVGGVEDKRLLIVETEFARILKVMGRNGSTLSMVLRQAYDGGTLQTLTKNSTDTATDPHICVIGHITSDELSHDMNHVEMSNGLANRFMWFYSKRAELVPNPEVYEPSAELVRLLRGAIEFGSQPRLVHRSPDANDYWVEAYRHLSDPQPGIIGAITARNAPNALRLSLLFSIMRRSETIGIEDIEAALEVIKYATQSARWLFESSPDRKEESIVNALMPNESNELTRNQIRADVLHNHSTAAQLNGLRDNLTTRGIIKWRTESTPGRNVEIWRLL